MIATASRQDAIRTLSGAGYAEACSPPVSALNAIDRRLDQAIDQASGHRARLNELVSGLEMVLGAGEPKSASDRPPQAQNAPRNFQDKTDMLLMLQSDIGDLIARLSAL